MNTSTETPSKTPESKKAPVKISGPAYAALTRKIREFSGWLDARLSITEDIPMGAPASCTHEDRTFRVNVNELLLNPNRVLLTVTPFRLKQEAVLTGAMLHEAGHARFSHWQPGRYGNPETLTHSAVHHNEPCSAMTLAFARLMEEPRVEGLMAKQARDENNGLGWTLRAVNAALLEPTALAADPDQQIMDLIGSWALRAGKHLALYYRIGHDLPDWVSDFNFLLHSELIKKITSNGVDINDANTQASMIGTLLHAMIKCDDHIGSEMIDMAKMILDVLFPETDGDAEDAPQPMQGCGMAVPPEQGEPDSQPGQGEQEDGQAEPAEPGDGDSDGQGGTSEQGEQEDGQGVAESDLAKALREMEEQAKNQETADITEAEKEEEVQQRTGATVGSGGGGMGGGFRLPTAEERQVQHGAERFLRALVEPSERSKVLLTSSPSAEIDGRALTEWKAGGQTREPHFFKRTVRTSEPSPPVKIAILVDTSMSMGMLQKPSALLSWALSAAALDMRNFAGRGQQIESTLIHWGDYARVVQPVGSNLPGIREVSCDEGTSALHEAMAMVEDQMPGFYDTPDRPVNRLLVQFTDWDLAYQCVDGTADWVSKALGSGVNMLSVVPSGFRQSYTSLPRIMSRVQVQRGHHTVLQYNPMFPSQVWESAAEALAL